MASTFKFRIEVPRTIAFGKRKLSREDFYSWIWERFGQRDLLGIHEGTVLSEDAGRDGLETGHNIGWTVDAAEAPRERDWLAGVEKGKAELYFANAERASEAVRELSQIPGLSIGPVEEQKPEDWDAKWKAAFLGSSSGVKVPPFWRILPPWVSPAEAKLDPEEIALKINPGAGFGTGTHETTQLCLEALGELGQSRGKELLSGLRALDFGSGSGILSIGAALLGASVEGVEIDPLAIENAEDNAKLNDVTGRVSFLKHLKKGESFPIVIANILRPVLLQFSDELVSRLKKDGTLILSGLIEGDIREVSARYGALLGGATPEVRERGEWRALVWQR